ncbi:hypothetical protein FDA94_15465 [Herbidospora galbida]|uniref:Uncharacterized protein n=1 Tax=Herbidospora galbida TaxID=2575442 RepID=A0A4U3MEZ2_9ACTN|nr:hypothetical protein [Herbidospora galbida]TKK87958.1 hypothetical protein FDA94_15465 [Herbidospora galbida]
MSSDGLWRMVRIGVVGLLLAAAVAGLVFGDAWLWTAVQWSPPPFLEFYGVDEFDVATIVALLGAAVLKAAFVWSILRPPMRGPVTRREKALRLLLYAVVAYGLVGWLPMGLLPDAVVAVFLLVLWTAVDVLFLLVIRWRSRLLRATAGVLFTVELIGLANEVLDELDLPELGPRGYVDLVWFAAGAGVTVVTLAGQRRDGRWSGGTLVAGWSSLGVQALSFALYLLTGGRIPGPPLPVTVLMDAAEFVSLVWIAATAREMPADRRPMRPSPARRRLTRAATAIVAVVPLMALVHPEQTPHLTFSGWSTDCYDGRGFGDLNPAEREAAFLCRARSVEGGPPLFPDTLSDQGVLAYGRALCHARDRDEQEAILTRAGSEQPAGGADPSHLVYVCPEIVGKSQPDLLLTAEETEAADAAWLAEENARCRDPWPRTKGVVQASVKYFLFADGDPGYMVYDPDDETPGPTMEEAMDELFASDDAIVAADGSAALIGHVADVIDLCLTVKAFRTPPPKRTAGWDHVAEVPIVSRTGQLTVPEMSYDGVGAGAPIPNLAIEGEGRYRLRVYVRVRAGEEQHLVVVFPGTSKKRLKLR